MLQQIHNSFLQRVLQRGQTTSSSFSFQYLNSLSSSYLRLLPRLSFHKTFPSIRQFTRKMWPIRLAFLLRYVECPFLLDSAKYSCIFHVLFQNFKSISNPLSEVSMLQHYTNLWS
jgi:hypothetical protein